MRIYHERLENFFAMSGREVMQWVGDRFYRIFRYRKIAFQRFTFPVPLIRPDSSNGRTQLVCPYEVNSCKLVVSFDKSFFAVGISVRVRFGVLIIKNFGYEKESDNRFPSCGRILIVHRVCIFGRTCVQPCSTGSCNRVRTLPPI